MLRFGITAWIAGGSSFLFLPEIPNEGERIASIIEDRRRAIETLELEVRIADLEQRK